MLDKLVFLAVLGMFITHGYYIIDELQATRKGTIGTVLFVPLNFGLRVISLCFLNDDEKKGTKRTVPIVLSRLWFRCYFALISEW